MYVRDTERYPAAKQSDSSFNHAGISYRKNTGVCQERIWAFP